MPKLTVSRDDVEFAINYLVQYLRDAGYQGSLEDGTAAYDLLVKPMAVLYTLFLAESLKTRAYMSLDAAAAYKTLLGSEYDTVVDMLLSNWFATRKPGTPATGSVRLVFSKPLESIQFAAGSPVCSIGSVTFAPTMPAGKTALVYTSGQFVQVVGNVTSSPEYYIDVPVTATTNSAAAIPAGTAVTPTITNIYLLRAEVVTALAAGTAAEASDVFISRTKEAVTTRELITYRAIATVLVDTFTPVTAVYVAGHGDAEQLRDVVEFQDVTVHVGNKADIYLHAPLARSIVAVTVPANGVVPFTTLGAHVAEVLAVTDTAGAPLPFTLAGVPETGWGAVGCVGSVSLAVIPADNQVRVSFLASDAIAAVVDFVAGAEQRVVCYDPLVKTKFPVVLSFNLTVTMAETLTDALKADLTKALVAYVMSRPPADDLVVSHLVQALHDAVPELVRLRLPMTVGYALRDPATMQLVQGAFQDRFVLPGALSAQATMNTVKFYTDANLVTVSEA